MTVTDADPPPRPLWRRLWPLAIVALAFAAFFGTGLNQHLSLDGLRENRAALQTFVAENRVLAVAAYMALYLLIVATLLPGVAAMTIAGGFLFGLWGTIPTVLAAALGATAVFLAARTVLAGVLAKRAGGFVQKFEQGFREGEFSYVFTMRLIPVLPFAVVNIAPALLGGRLGTFFFASLLGMLPGTFVYTSIGSAAGVVFDQGGELELTGVLTQPQFLLPIVGLAALALLPIVIRRLRRRPEPRV